MIADPVDEVRTFLMTETWVPILVLVIITILLIIKFKKKKKQTERIQRYEKQSDRASRY